MVGLHNARQSYKRRLTIGKQSLAMLDYETRQLIKRKRDEAKRARLEIASVKDYGSRLERCHGINRAGEKCRAWALTDKLYCGNHLDQKIT